MVAAKANRRLVTLSGGAGYIAFHGIHGSDRVKVLVSSGRHIDRDAVNTVELAGKSAELGLVRKRAADNYSVEICLDAGMRTTWSKQAPDLLTTYFGAAAFQVTTRFEIHRATNPEPLHASMEFLASNRTWGARTGLYMTLVKSDLVLALASAHSAPSLSGAAIYASDRLSGRPVAAVFSSVTQLDAFEPRGLDALVVSGIELFPFLAEQGLASVLINPGGLPRGEIYANEVLTLVQGIQRLRH